MSVTLGVRRQVRMGPALRGAPLPVGGLVLSVALHALCMVFIVFGGDLLRREEPEIYVVNLVPAVAAIGSPNRPTPPAPAAPPAPTPRPPAPPRETPREAPPPPQVTAPREPSRPSPPPALPPREPPPREVVPRELPPRPSTAAALPEPTLPARTPATPTPAPRPEEKELPAMATARAPSAVAPSTSAPPAPPPPAAPQPTPLPTTPVAATAPAAAGQSGLPTGSPVGTDEVSTEVDFPYAWYIQAMVRKIREHWDARALPGQQPIITFDVARDGTVNVSRIKVRESSGNSMYDQAAIRAIASSVPFPPLPADFKRDPLTVHIRFRFERDRG